MRDAAAGRETEGAARAAWTEIPYLDCRKVKRHVAGSYPLLLVFLLGEFSGRLGGYGYGSGHGAMGVIAVVLDDVVVLLLLGQI